MCSAGIPMADRMETMLALFLPVECSDPSWISRHPSSELVPAG